MAGRGVNKVILVGRLGGDPEMRYTPDGRAIATVNLATSESWKDKNTGQMQEKTEWHRVVVFNKLAEIVGQYLKKGSQVYFEGKLQTRKWQDQGGQDRYTTEVVVDISGQMQMLDSRGSGGDTAYGQNNTSQQHAPQHAAPQPQQHAAAANNMNQAPSRADASPAEDVIDDDIPF